MNFICRLCKSWLLCQRAARTAAQLFRVGFAWCHQRDVAAEIVRRGLSAATADTAVLRAPQLLKQRALSCMVPAHCARRASAADVARPGGAAPVTAITQRVQQVLTDLSDEQRKILTRVDLGGCSYQEVATLLDLSVPTVVRHLCEIRVALSSRLLRRSAVSRAQGISLVSAR